MLRYDNHMFGGITSGRGRYQITEKAMLVKTSTRHRSSSCTSLAPPENKNFSSFEPVVSKTTFQQSILVTLKTTRQLPPPLGRPCISRSYQDLFSCICVKELINHYGPDLEHFIGIFWWPCQRRCARCWCSWPTPGSRWSPPPKKTKSKLTPILWNKDFYRMFSISLNWVGAMKHLLAA